MDKTEFFIKKNEVVELNISGQIFKFRKVTADDELNWIEEYKEQVIEKNQEGKEITVVKQNLKKLAKCKLRNIVDIPFSKEELKDITGIDKDYNDYSKEDKDLLFGQLNPDIMSKIIAEIDKTRSNKKKS